MNPAGGTRNMTTSHVTNTRGSHLSRKSMMHRATTSRTTMAITRSENTFV